MIQTTRLTLLEANDTQTLNTPTWSNWRRVEPLISSIGLTPWLLEWSSLPISLVPESWPSMQVHRHLRLHPRLFPFHSLLLGNAMVVKTIRSLGKKNSVCLTYISARNFNSRRCQPHIFFEVKLDQGETEIVNEKWLKSGLGERELGP